MFKPSIAATKNYIISSKGIHKLDDMACVNVT